MSRVNILQMIIIHDLDEKSMACSSSFPYICDAADKDILSLRALLLKRFEELTDPQQGAAPVAWGEDGDEPGDASEVKLLVPSGIKTEGLS
jgi:hypothetical protein